MLVALLLLLLPLLLVLLLLLFKLLLVVELVKAVVAAVLFEGEAVEGLQLRLEFAMLVKALAGETLFVLEEGEPTEEGEEVEEVTAGALVVGFAFLPPLFLWSGERFCCCCCCCCAANCC